MRVFLEIDDAVGRLRMEIGALKAKDLFGVEGDN